MIICKLTLQIVVILELNCSDMNINISDTNNISYNYLNLLYSYGFISSVDQNKNKIFPIICNSKITDHRQMIE